MNKPVIAIGLILLASLFGNSSFAQEERMSARSAEIEATEKLFYSGEYVFQAETMQPSGYFSRRMDPGYKIIVSKDSIICNLPYVGRAYSAPIGQTDIGIKFISTQFSYTYKNRNKSGWIVTIKPKDDNEVRSITMTILDNQSASITIISNNRQPISFSGMIVAR